MAGSLVGGPWTEVCGAKELVSFAAPKVVGQQGELLESFRLGKDGRYGGYSRFVLGGSIQGLAQERLQRAACSPQLAYAYVGLRLACTRFISSCWK